MRIVSETEKKDIEAVVYQKLRGFIDKDYIDGIYNAIINDVIECADINWNDSDVSLAIGRAFSRKLGIEF
jgi:hypothetical protein